MATKYHVGLRRHLKRVTSFLGTVALSALVVLSVQHLLAPPRASAQAGQAQEVRASAFVLVAADGTVVGRLAPSANGGGRLTLYDNTGAQRAAVAGAGVFAAFDPDGTTLRFLAGYTPTAAPNSPQIDGVQLEPGGTVGELAAFSYNCSLAPQNCGQP